MKLLKLIFGDPEKDEEILEIEKCSRLAFKSNETLSLLSDKKPETIEYIYNGVLDTHKYLKYAKKPIWTFDTKTGERVLLSLDEQERFKAKQF